MSKVFKTPNDKFSDRQSYEMLAYEFIGAKDLPKLLECLKKSKERNKNTISWAGSKSLDADIKNIEILINN